MNQRTKENSRLLKVFKTAKERGEISNDEYMNIILLLMDRMSALENDTVKIDKIINCIKSKIKTEQSVLEFVRCEFSLN